MRRLVEALERSPGVQRLIEVLAAGQSVSASGVWDTPKAFLIYLASRKIGAPVLSVSRGVREAEQLYDDLVNVAPARTMLLPAWETLPHEEFKPHPEIVGDRIRTMLALVEPPPDIGPPMILASVQSVLLKAVHPELLGAAVERLVSGEAAEMDTVLRRLVELGYERFEIVQEKGHCSVRGGILDLWPIHADLPVRVEFFGDEIASIRQFDPSSQRSTGPVRSVRIPPADELAFLKENAGELVSLLDYLPPNALVVLDDPGAMGTTYDEVFGDAPEKSPLLLDLDQFRDLVEDRLRLVLPELPILTAAEEALTVVESPFQTLPGLKGTTVVAVEETAQIEVFESIPGWLEGDAELFLVCNNTGELDRLKTLLDERGVSRSDAMQFVIGSLNSGFALPDANVIAVPDKDIFHRYKIRRGPRRFKGSAPIRDFTELEPGDYVVHVDNGIGRYFGVVTLPNQDPHKEYLGIEYSEKAKLYVPIAQANLVTKFIGADGHVPQLDTLGGARWLKVKRRTQRAIEDYASELLDLYAARAAKRGHVFAPDTEWQREFEDAFIYEETDDQIRAITDLKADLERPQPTDRLVCGDVGYGKTEVAIRAAFKAVMDQKQVAVLVPTTVLAQQHYHTFRDRMADYPVRVEMLSRFRKRAELTRTVEALARGDVDVVIGTHRLLSKDIEFKDLGLVVIDEEQRFGVKHKERLKHLRKLVDVVTMTATPIPRTLYMSLVGARDMSTINTPPHDRLPVKTILAEYNPDLVRTAIQRELNRGGQVFFLHNRIATIERVKEVLQELVPKATIMTAHGEMHEGELEMIMETFIAGRVDVLVCTTIIESGIDIPNANTIIIDRADRFGLADLYQLRGRVGRWKHQAYAYLLVPKSREILETARKRLRAVLEAQGYGAGFQIAMRDLEIRGAGNILGVEQHGHINAIGFHLYCSLLKRTIERLKGHDVPMPGEVTMRLGFDAAIPAWYVPEAAQRIDLYKRLGEIVSTEDLDEFTGELCDRFGTPPEETLALLDAVSLRVFAQGNGLERVEVNGDKLIVERRGRKLMVSNRFPRLERAGSRTVTAEIKTVLQKLLG
ncbi:MAG: transcription-repair coupling factor [Verrucomicrobia bacterium]|nr:transcription-repair coupling factor [Verrucomicrobiota bacterium]